MPIVSDHPSSIDVIRRLTVECDPTLESWVSSYSERRRAFESSRSRLTAQYVEDDEREEMGWRELVALIEAREASIEQLRDELNMMDKELVLLRREARRVRRKFVDEIGVEEFATPATPAYSSGIPQMPSLQDLLQKAKHRDSWAWLKPWLRSFLPSSA